MENERGEILLTQRTDPKIPAAHLAWDFPGGTVEFGEDPRETVRRELSEEVGITVSVGDLLPDVVSQLWQHDDYQLHAIVVCFRCVLKVGTARAADKKIATVQWVAKSQLSVFKFLPTTQRFVELLTQ